MPNYRRAIVPGGTFFLTLVTQRRVPIFAAQDARANLRGALERCNEFHPFELDAIVLLPDHLHVLMTLPIGDADFSRRISHIKATFTRSYLADGGHEEPRSPSRLRQRARGVWQRRFWEHTITDEDDLHRHLDYIHYNAVKHRHVACPHDWPHSSFHRYASEGYYDRDWCCQCHGSAVPPIGLDKIAVAAGE
jgi:putative transposase